MFYHYQIKSLFLFSFTVLQNIALRKPVKQSSTSSIYEAKYAVDGNRGTNLAVDMCASTENGDTNPWWSVDLQAVYSIKAVIILNRGNDEYGTGRRTEG